MESNISTAAIVSSGDKKSPPIPKNPISTKSVNGELVKSAAKMDPMKALEALYGLREKTASERDSIVTNSNTEQMQKLDSTIAWMEVGAQATEETLEAFIG